MKRQLCVQKLDIFLIESPRGYASSFIARKALRWTRILSHQKQYPNTVQYGKLRTDRGSWFISEFFLKLAFLNIHDTFKAGNWSSQVFLKLVYFTTPSKEIDNSDQPPAIVSSESVERQVRGDPYSSETSEELLNEPTKIQKPNKNENHKQVRGDPYYYDIPEWLQEFRENLVGERVLEHRDSHARSSREPSLEPTSTRSADLSEHRIYTNFPKDRSCEICQRTNITRGPCRRRIGRVVPIWLQQITKFSVKVVNLETIIDMQSWCKT